MTRFTRRLALALVLPLFGLAQPVSAAVPATNVFPIANRTRSSCSNSFGDPRENNRSHMGIDCFAPIGTPLLAVESGTIEYAQPQTKPFKCEPLATGETNGNIGGNNLKLAGASGTRYYYAHLDQLLVTTGQQVTKGQVIGTVGRTGNANCSTPHLHFEIHNPAPVNPYPLMQSWTASAGVPGPAPTPTPAPGPAVPPTSGTDFMLRWGTDNYDLYLARPGGVGFTAYGDVLGNNVGTEGPLYPGDFNGDGLTDFMLTQGSNEYHVLLRQGASFTPSWNVFGGQIGVTAEAPIFGDFDGNGRTDFMLRWGTDTYDLFLADPDGRTFSAHGDIFGPNVGTQVPIETGDFDGNGRTDFMLRQAPAGYHVFLSNGTTFTPHWNVFNGNVGVTPERPTMGDFDGNGRTDFMLRWGTDNYDLFLANPDGRTFSAHGDIFGPNVGVTGEPPIPGSFG